MSASITSERVSGFDGITLENSRIRVSIIPELGGRVWALLDRARGRQWIWHRDDVPLSTAHAGSAYDDVWAGGWEELFPNDAPADFEGRALPDHGEWWSSVWKVDEASTGTDAVLRLVTETKARQTSCAKEFRLGGDSDTLRVTYRIENREPEAFHFLFKQHLAVALTASCQLALPGGRVTAVDPTFGTLMRGSGTVDWPLTGSADLDDADLRRVRPRADHREFVYVSELPESWCGVDDVDAGASLRMSFDKTLPFVWLFLSYGGWRDCYTAVLEPCTNMPKDLEQAVRDGQSARLDAGAVFQTSVGVTLSAYSARD